MLRTVRLELVAATAPLVQAEMQGIGSLERMLGAELGVGWPPELCTVDTLEWALDRIARDARFEEWGMRYLVLKDPSEGSRVIGVAGYHGPPEEGAVEIGYSLLHRYRGRGLAGEAVAALVAHALAHPAIDRVIAHTPPDAHDSLGLLESTGFRFDGEVVQDGRRLARYVRSRTGDHASHAR